jgi:dienelactone hydrolase
MTGKDFKLHWVRWFMLFLAFSPLWVRASSSEVNLCNDQQKHIQSQAFAKFAQRSAPRLVGNDEIDLNKSRETHEGELAFGPEHKWRISFTFYHAKDTTAATPTPLLFIFPGITGITMLDRHAAHYFSRHGYSVVISHYFDPSAHESFATLAPKMAQGVFANLALVDYFSALPGIDPGRLVSLGVSFGGIRALYHSLVDKRLKASILFVSGPLPEVMAYSQMDGMPEMRIKHMAEAKLRTPAHYRDAVEKQLQFKISDWACRRRSDDYFMYISDKDTMVPTHTQWNLYEQLGSPEHMRRSSLGHVKSSVWAMIWHKKEMLEFFDERI